MTTLVSASLSRHSRSIEPTWLAHGLTVCLGLGLAVTCSGGFRNSERGFSHWRAKRARKFFGCHAHFRSRWKSELNISKQL